jgi:hypothetical protein
LAVIYIGSRRAATKKNMYSMPFFSLSDARVRKKKREDSYMPRKAMAHKNKYLLGNQKIQC